MHYLDNLRVFLVFLVLLHNALIMFGGGPAAFDGGGIILGNFGNAWFPVAASIIMLLNQTYFMPLLFFISGYFTPPSLKKKG